ncbi:Zinc finger protein 846 [Portunus trituberculatus]|uniref:Zinc finger protein 846 n=2 Tax=Portunus trituberculatus TaxID=210409 RepID=A0A5B7FCV8_PORTR|nr:Zinc finger protein 846 [Portunus trituberculatus]
MAQNSAISLKDVTHKATAAVTTTIDRELWEHQCREGGDPCSFVGFELDSRSAKLFSDLKQILMKKNIKKEVSGLNGVIMKGEDTRLTLSTDGSVESESLYNPKKVFKEDKNFPYGMKKKDSLVNIEKMALHDKTSGVLEDVCFVSIAGDSLNSDDDENSTDIIIIKEIVHNDSRLVASGVQQNSELVQSSKERVREADLEAPYLCMGHKEPSPLVVELKPGNYSMDPEMEVMQESQYHLYAAPEIIEEVVTVEDMEGVEEADILSSTFFTPASSVNLDHSYCSPPPPWPLQTLNDSLQSHTEEQYSDVSECETLSVTSEMMDGALVCHSGDDVSAGLASASLPLLDDDRDEASSAVTTHCAFHQSHLRGGDNSNGLSCNVSLLQPHITTDHISSEPKQPRQDERVDRMMNTCFLTRVKKSPAKIPTSLPEGKPAQETYHDHKLLSPKDVFYNRNSQILQMSEMNVENDGSEETGSGNNRESQRAGSQERMMIRSSIQLRKRKIYKLIQVPQRESINFDKMSDIDTYYTNDVTSFEDDLPVSTEKKEIEKPLDLFPSSKAEKKAATKIWQVLVSQLEDCVRGITTLPPAVSVHTKKRKRSLSSRRAKGSTSLQVPRKSDSRGDGVGASCAENQNSQASQCEKIKEGSNQAVQSCIENRNAENKRKCVCFCRYNTVLPLASRRTCCGRKKVQSGCRRSSRTIRKEDMAFPTDQKTFFQNLGLMEKSLYDKDVFYESLVTHRTRNVRANQIKGKDHYRMFLDNLHGDALDQSSDKLKQPFPLAFITKQNLCKLSTRSKPANKGSNLPWLRDEHATEHNFEGFCDVSDSQRRRIGDTSLRQKFEFEPSVSLDDVSSSSASKSGTLSSMPFCCTDTNDNFTENCIIPKTQQDLLPALSKASVDLEECPVCEKSNGACPLGHKLEMESLNSRVLEEKGQSSLVVTKEEVLQPCQPVEGAPALLVEEHDKDDCEGALPDSWSDCMMKEMTEDTPAQPSLGQHSVPTSDTIEVDEHNGDNCLRSLPDSMTIGAENVPRVCSVFSAAALSTPIDDASVESVPSDTMEVDEDDCDSCLSSLPDLMSIGTEKVTEKVPKICSLFPAATMSTPGDDTSVESVRELLKSPISLFHDESDKCDFLGFDEPHCHILKTSPQLEAKINATHNAGDVHNRDIFCGRSKLKPFMEVLGGQHGSVDVSKEIEELSCYATTLKADKLSRTITSELGMESEAEAVMSLATKRLETVKDPSSPIPKSPSKNDNTSKLGEFDLSRNCRVNLTKLKMPGGAMERVKVDIKDSIVTPLFSTDLSPEKLIKSPEKLDSESHITFTRFPKRQNVKKIKYSELLKSNIRRSLNGMHRTERPDPTCGSKHSRSTSDGVLFRCCSCPATFRSKGALTGHLQTHKKKEFTCLECGLSFQEEVLLHSHRRLHSTAREAVLCEKCGESFSQLEDLRNHVKNHLSPKSPKCKMCNQTCNCQLASNESLEMHLKDCKNRCVECRGTLVVPSILKRNTRTHDRGKPHHCALCSDNMPHDN